MNKSTITREPITHDLKIYPESFSAVCTGVKRAELRKNDRDYRVGDTLHLMETPRGSCHQTGEFINVKIIHIAPVGEWMPGYVLLSVELQERRKPLQDKDLQGVIDALEHPAGINAAGKQVVRHALLELQERRKADDEPVAWTDEEELRDVNVAGIGYLFGIDREANKFADPRRQIMLYRHAQPAPVVPDFKKLARELVDNLVDCGGLDEGVKEKYLEWAEKTCRAAMLAATPQEVK